MAAISSEKIEYCRPGELPGVELLLARNATSGWRFFHYTYTVCTLLRAPRHIEWSYRRRRHSFKAGEMSLMEPGEVHVSDARASCDFHVAFFDPALVQRAARELGMASAPHLNAAQLSDGRLFRAFEGLHAAVLSGASTLECESHVAEAVRLLLAHCTETGTPPVPRDSRVRLLAARELIQENFSRPIRLQELAVETGLSRYHLVRAFAKEFSLAPHAYQINVQVQKARAYLAEGRSPADVAAEVGFTDQSHFTRHFKRITGITPGSYARAVR